MHSFSIQFVCEFSCPIDGQNLSVLFNMGQSQAQVCSLNRALSGQLHLSGNVTPAPPSPFFPLNYCKKYAFGISEVLTESIF